MCAVGVGQCILTQIKLYTYLKLAHDCRMVYFY